MTWETVWQFRTRRFTVSLAVAPEDGDPADSFEYEADVDLPRESEWSWFQARVQVTMRDGARGTNWAIPRERVLGEAYLGGCSYASRDEFVKDGLRDMVTEAVREARITLGDAPRVREVA